MKKKLLSLALAAVCVVSLVACGNDEKDESKKENGGAVTAKVIEYNLTSEEYAFGVDKDQPELLEQVNTFIDQIIEDGTLAEISEKYFGDGEPTPVESAELDASKDQLVVATNAAFEPFEFMKGESYYGIDMEVAALLAEELGKELVIQNMEFDAVCLSVGQQKCDVAMAGLTVNEERKEYVTFSNSYYEASQKLIVRSDDTTFDQCANAEEVIELLEELDEDVKIGVQSGTTGQYFIEGDESWGFEGLDAKCVPYRNGSLAVQDMLNGNIQYVIIDAAPATAITSAINEMQ